MDSCAADAEFAPGDPSDADDDAASRSASQGSVRRDELKHRSRSGIFTRWSTLASPHRRAAAWKCGDTRTDQPAARYRAALMALGAESVQPPQPELPDVCIAVIDEVRFPSDDWIARASQIARRRGREGRPDALELLSACSCTYRGRLLLHRGTRPRPAAAPSPSGRASRRGRRRSTRPPSAVRRRSGPST
jgi:hypothetical protein